MANDEAKKLNDEYISTEHIFLGIASERNTPSANILREANLVKEQIYAAIQELRNGQRVTDGIALIVAIRTYQPGETIEFTVRRDGAERVVEVTLDSEVG